MLNFCEGLKWKHLEAIQRLEQVLESGQTTVQKWPRISRGYFAWLGLKLTLPAQEIFNRVSRIFNSAGFCRADLWFKLGDLCRFSPAFLDA
jgi:hypothetical protein